MPLTGEEKREYQRAWMKRRRDTWVEKNGPCKQCGSSKNLEVDHIYPEEKALEPRSLWSLSPNNSKRTAELAKCQVLCQRCHQAKTAAFLSVKHRGTRASSASLTDDTLEEVRRRLVLGERGSEIARELGISKYTVSRVKRGVAYAL